MAVGAEKVDKMKSSFPSNPHQQSESLHAETSDVSSCTTNSPGRLGQDERTSIVAHVILFYGDRKGLLSVKRSYPASTSPSLPLSKRIQLLRILNCCCTAHSMQKVLSAAKKVRHHRKKSSQMTYPPRMLDEQFEALISDIKDWQITNGSLLKVVDTDNGHTVQSHPVGTTLFPTLFPKELFDEARDLQKTYNKLYAAVAEDEEWLFDTLKHLIDVDPLANRLWIIYQEVKNEGYIQDLSLGIFRSDYMLHVHPDAQGQEQLKQVEFNTISCAGGVHSHNISSMHQHLLRTGLYESTSSSPQLTASSLPPNTTLHTLAEGLGSAHRLYGPATSRIAKETCILMIVQPHNFNIADERPIEYFLWNSSIPCFRVAFGYEVLSHTSLTLNRELLYQPPHRSTPLEVSVVYFRSGFELQEYADDMGHMARFQLEKSKAIKCPNLLGHLSTFKKVQQALTVPGVLEKFLTPEESRTVGTTFMSMWPLDESEEGQQAKKLATDPTTAAKFVLKPSLEGGGHNVYGVNIAEFLAKLPKELWHTYVLMEKIVPPSLKNTMMSAKGLYEGPVVSELGVFGVCIWKSNQGGGRAEIVEETDPCWSFRTKSSEVNEMSVVKGYGCFDSPALVDDEVFKTCAGNGSK